MLGFVQDMLEAEADALKKGYAYATRTTADTEAATRQVSEMRREIENDQGKLRRSKGELRNDNIFIDPRTGY